MIILCLKTDQSEAYVALFKDRQKLIDQRWVAGKELSNTIYKTLETLLADQKLAFSSVEGLVCYKGPGSFTGLRIGLSLANSLAYANNAIIVSSEGDYWADEGIDRLMKGENEKIAIPHYGGDANITQPRK